jgi:hypothetical protein
MMRFGVALWLVPLAALGAAQPPGNPRGEGPDEVERKLQLLRQQIDDLRKQEQALLKLQEEQKREAAEKKAQFGRVEVRGRLVRNMAGPFGPQEVAPWAVEFGDLIWALELRGGKELQALAEKLDGKPVLLKGKVEAPSVGAGPGPRGGPRPGGFSSPAPVIVVESLKAAE